MHTLGMQNILKPVETI